MNTIWLLFTIGFVSAKDSYKGCYKNSEESESPLLALNYPSKPSECTKECKNRYYMYAGLMKGQLCYCMSRYGSGSPSNGCSNTCIGDKSSFCGSEDSVSVYETGQKGSSPPKRLNVVQRQTTSLYITWERPDITNGVITSYTVRAVPGQTYASYPLQPTQVQIQGESSDNTIITNLHPGTQYNISITAMNAKEESEPTYTVDWTLIGPPNNPEVPKIISREGTKMVIEISEGSSQNGPLTVYQIIVVYPGIVPPTDHNIAYPNYDKAIRDGFLYYITGEFEASEFMNHKQFVVGDGQKVGGYYNAPLEKPFDRPQIGIALVSKVRNEIQYSYSDLTGHAFMFNRLRDRQGLDGTAIGLCVAIVLLGTLLIVSVVSYFVIKRRHEQIRMNKLPEQQELTLQGPMYEVDNMGYIPEEVPERPNHYQDLKSKVWSIPKNFLIVDSTLIRRGRFGTIHSGTVQHPHGESSKVIVHSISDGSLRPSEKRHMLRDLDACIKAGTMKYLASLVGNCETPDTLYVVLEMPAQNLKTRLLAARSGNAFPTEKLLPIGASIASGLDYLDAHKIYHSHLCARSIGLTDDFEPKIMGYGIGKHSLEDLKLARWTAPERFGHKKHNPAVVWAYGVVIWEMMSMGGTPYSELEDECDVEEAVVEKFVRLKQLPDMPDPLYEVLLSCWHVNTDERPTFDELSRLSTLGICPITVITEPYRPELELN
ncbi:putative tyrosine-protein kinase Wsck [Chelonus insularis]|uniref:putative tyrosine-protein kinase Wsck n=1 Tax=Chelonus insularis TaxID=460826 RepID=UPI00158AEC80|nr:putative tyrosine-protein kinase Wsck [Chelonus insularis]